VKLQSHYVRLPSVSMTQENRSIGRKLSRAGLSNTSHVGWPAIEPRPTWWQVRKIFIGYRYIYCNRSFGPTTLLILSVRRSVAQDLFLLEYPWGSRQYRR
jgi:hypothetical protein